MIDLKNLFYNISDFELTDQKLGKGGFGEVYKAQNIKTKKMYAAKILISADDEFNSFHQMNLMQESLILHKLNHPGILKFQGINFQSLRDHNKFEPSLITEFMTNGSLRSNLSNSKLNATQKYINLLGISHAMKYLHENSILHRDLKPENILSDEKFYPRICDFGLSKCFQESFTKSIQFMKSNNCGTPFYMAPELFDDCEYYSPALDVYSFAILAYEIVTGNEPFAELNKNCINNWFQFAKKVISGYRPSIPDTVPKKMKELISKCWHEKPNERPSFIEIFNELSCNFSLYTDEEIHEEEINSYINELRKFETNKTNNTNNLLFDQNENTKINNDQEKKTKKLDKLIQSKSGDELYCEGLKRLIMKDNEYGKKEGILLIEKSSEKGNSCSSNLMGFLYENGIFVEHNFEKAKFYYERSSNIGCHWGLHQIGQCYKNGSGVEIDIDKSIEYFCRASEKGNAKSINSLGILYKNGIGFEQDYSMALKCFIESSNRGCSDAFVNLGYLYEKGKGVPIDINKAKEYYCKAEELGNSHAKYRLEKINKKK